MSRILIAEDEPMLREVYTTLLEAHGHEVEGVENGLRVIELCDKVVFDLLLLDIMMPEMTGVEVLEKARERSMKLPPTIVFSNLSSGSEIDRARELGVRQCVVKSDMTPSDIVALVDSVLHR